MKNLIILLILISSNAFGAAYLGLNYGMQSYNSSAMDKYKVHPKGNSYGAFFGMGRDFVGLEAFYQNFETKGKIKHDGGNYDLEANAKAFGAALRFSFEMFYMRLGLAQYNLSQAVKIDDATTRRTAEEVYDIQNGSKNGMMYGVGLHKKMGSARIFLDYTRYQITQVGSYDTISAGIAFAIPDRFFDVGRN